MLPGEGVVGVDASVTFKDVLDRPIDTQVMEGYGSHAGRGG